jgi:surfactin synthase thioesterase subunit
MSKQHNPPGDKTENYTSPDYAALAAHSCLTATLAYEMADALKRLHQIAALFAQATGSPHVAQDVACAMFDLIEVLRMQMQIVDINGDGLELLSLIDNDVMEQLLGDRQNGDLP